MASSMCLKLLVLVTSLVSSHAVEWNELRCTFSAIDIFRIDSFFQLPITLAAAKEKGWTQPGETHKERHITTLCEKEDARVCLLYSNKGSLAGYQIAIPLVVDALRMKGIDWEQKGFTSATLFGNQWYIARIFFESQDTINKGGRVNDGLVAEGLWLPLDGRLQEIPRKESELLAKIPWFKKQNCYSKMGVHYFYNISKKLSPQDYQPFFLLYSTGGDLIGWGLNAFGSKASKNKPFKEYIPFLKKRNWFENVPSSKVRDVAPDTPDWALEYLDDFGSYSHHVYLVQKPWKISC